MPVTRECDRHSTDVLLTYRIAGKKLEGEFSIGITHNISKSGVCLYLLEEVKAGEKLTLIYNPVTGDKCAVVKWVKRVQDGIYKAGVMFE